MRKLINIMLGAAPLATASLAFGAPAGGEEAGAHAELLIRPETAVPAMVAAIIMFALLYFALKKLAWGAIISGLNDRETKIRTEIESAENARAQATKALEDYQKELAKARGEASAMIQQARGDAQRVGDELRARNEAELTSMKNKAKEEIEAAKRAALNELYAETALLATQVAGRILQREIKPADHAKLVEESLSQISGLSDGRD